MTLKIVADHANCVGAGLCALNAPELFDQDENDGIVRVLVDTPSPDQYDLADAAIQSCPAQAISLTE
ncbi:MULTISPECIES: ferredoxin [Streptomyces]|uniref:Ferredoxin n=1 Tax=Streptomyces alboflavus TaxID=67267 RepID=A0A1Z1WKY0_9ACTN|nr:ferredoxin [Streptomyces alboflavus]ARX87029.1 hypothetical protein SMD44_06510 [Streptomyces alboflavus]